MNSHRGLASVCGGQSDRGLVGRWSTRPGSSDRAHRRRALFWSGRTCGLDSERADSGGVRNHRGDQGDRAGRAVGDGCRALAQGVGLSLVDGRC